MPDPVKTNNFITPVARGSYVHVWEKAKQINGAMKYDISLIIPKDDPGIPSIKAAIKQAGIDKFGDDTSKWPKPFWNPLRDGDTDRGEGVYSNCFYLSPKSDKPVGVVGPDAKPLLDQDQFYSGCYCRASVNFYGFDSSGKKGVGVGLNNVMKIRDGERLDGRASAEDEFSEYATETENVTESNPDSFLD